VICKKEIRIIAKTAERLIYTIND